MKMSPSLRNLGLCNLYKDKLMTESLRVPNVDLLIPTSRGDPSRFAPETIVTTNYKLTMQVHCTKASHGGEAGILGVWRIKILPHFASHIIGCGQKLVGRMRRPGYFSNSKLVSYKLCQWCCCSRPVRHDG